MKTFKEYHAKERAARIIMLVLLAVMAYGYYYITKSVGSAVTFFAGAFLMNLVVGYARSAFAMFGDWIALRRRLAWETSMLNAMQLAKAADLYHVDDPNVLSAFHAAVQVRQDEGVKLGYLDLGRL